MSKPSAPILARADGFQRVDELREAPLTVIDQLTLPVPASDVWAIVGDFRRLSDLSASIKSVEPLPGGFRVKSSGAESVARLECRIENELLVGTYTDSAYLGMKVPMPEVDAFWVLLGGSDGQTEVEFGRAFRFKNRFAQAGARALLPMHERFNRDLALGLERLLAPAQVEGGIVRVPRLTIPLSAGQAPRPLRDDEARRLRELKFRGHKVFYFGAAVAMNSDARLTQDLGRLGAKAVDWHSERTARRHHEQATSDGQAQELMESLLLALASVIEAPISDELTDTLISGCRIAGLKGIDDVTAGLGVARFGLGVGQLESLTYRRATSRRVRKLVQGLSRLPDGPTSGNIAKAAHAVADNRSAEGTAVSLMDMPGFSSYARGGLAAISGACVDASPDMSGARSHLVRRQTERLFSFGLATHFIVGASLRT